MDISIYSDDVTTSVWTTRIIILPARQIPLRIFNTPDEGRDCKADKEATMMEWWWWGET